MLHRDSVPFPCHCFVRLWFRGQIADHVLESALAAALKHHPLLTATIDCSAPRPRWKLSEEHRIRIEQQPGCSGRFFPQTFHIPIESQPGLRIFAERSSDSVTLLVQFHHACCDGLGIMYFLRDYLKACRTLSSPDSGLAAASSIAPITSITPAAGIDDRAAAESSCVATQGTDSQCSDPREDIKHQQVIRSQLQRSQLQTRGDTGVGLSEWLRLLPAHILGLYRPWNFFRRRVQKILPDDESASASGITENTSECSLISTVLPPEVAAAWLKSAKKRSVSANDLLLKDVLAAIVRLRKKLNSRSGDGWIRLLVPINSRPNSDGVTMAANSTTMIFIDRRETDVCSSLENDHGDLNLLRGLSREMHSIRKHRLGLSFLLSLKLLQIIPGGLKRFAGGKRQDLTAVVTNLGRVFTDLNDDTNGKSASRSFQCGNATLERVDVAAPVSVATDISISAATYSDQISLTLQFGSKALSREQASFFLSELTDQIRSSAGLTVSSSPDQKGRDGG
jgi:hypothetical protein